MKFKQKLTNLEKVQKSTKFHKFILRPGLTSIAKNKIFQRVILIRASLIPKKYQLAQIFHTESIFQKKT